jgi:hypothetical protein
MSNPLSLAEDDPTQECPYKHGILWDTARNLEGKAVEEYEGLTMNVGVKIGVAFRNYIQNW